MISGGLDFVAGALRSAASKLHTKSETQLPPIASGDCRGLQVDQFIQPSSEATTAVVTSQNALLSTFANNAIRYGVFRVDSADVRNKKMAESSAMTLLPLRAYGLNSPINHVFTLPEAFVLRHLVNASKMFLPNRARSNANTAAAGNLTELVPLLEASEDKVTVLEKQNKALKAALQDQAYEINDIKVHNDRLLRENGRLRFNIAKVVKQQSSLKELRIQAVKQEDEQADVLMEKSELERKCDFLEYTLARILDNGWTGIESAAADGGLFPSTEEIDEAEEKGNKEFHAKMRCRNDEKSSGSFASTLYFPDHDLDTDFSVSEDEEFDESRLVRKNWLQSLNCVDEDIAYFESLIDVRFLFTESVINPAVQSYAVSSWLEPCNIVEEPSFNGSTKSECNSVKQEQNTAKVGATRKSSAGSSDKRSVDSGYSSSKVSLRRISLESKLHSSPIVPTCKGPLLSSSKKGTPSTPPSLHPKDGPIDTILQIKRPATVPCNSLVNQVDSNDVATTPSAFGLRSNDFRKSFLL